MVNEELIKRVNAIQILIEALIEELIEKKIINEKSVLNRIEQLDDDIEEVKSILYFGPVGEA